MNFCDFPAFSLHFIAPEIHDGDRLYDAGWQINCNDLQPKVTLSTESVDGGVFFSNDEANLAILKILALHSLKLT